MKKNDIIDIKITSIDRNGNGTGLYKDLQVAVSRTIPGDTIKARVLSVNRKAVTAVLESISLPSADRIQPACEAFNKGCGGCQWLNMDYGTQLKWKDRLIQENFKNMNCRIDSIVPDSSGMGCRNKFSLINHEGRLSFMQEYSHDAVFLSDCPMEMDTIIPVFKKLIVLKYPPDVLQIHIRASPSGTCGLSVFIRKMTPQVRQVLNLLKKSVPGLSGITLESYRDSSLFSGIESIQAVISGLTYHIPHNGFFQTNYFIAGLLLEEVLNISKNMNKPDTLDLYCGNGFFSLALARAGNRVLGFENNINSVKNARYNAVKNSLNNCRFEAVDVLAGIKPLDKGIYPLIILDPPRNGCGEAVMNELERLSPSLIIYVSCHMETLKKDLSKLNDYELTRISPFDMFPQTHHVETLALLERKNSKSGYGKTRNFKPAL